MYNRKENTMNILQKILKRTIAFLLVVVLGLMTNQTTALNVQAAVKKPSKVKIKTVKSINSDTIRVVWKKAKNAEKYQVYRATAKDGTYKLVKTTKATSFKNTGLKDETTYYYKVRAVNGNKKSSFSAALFAKTKPLGKKLWKKLPDEFVFTSGAGGWATILTIKNDGTFKGEYHDSDMGDYGKKYPNGVVYFCDFKGKFTTPKKVSEHIYSVKLKSLTVKEEEGKVYYEDGFKYITSGPYGFDNADEFYIYMPGSPVSKMEEGFLSWLYWGEKIPNKFPKGMYGIYNISGEEGFVGFSDDYKG